MWVLFKLSWHEASEQRGYAAWRYDDEYPVTIQRQNHNDGAEHCVWNKTTRKQKNMKQNDKENETFA